MANSSRVLLFTLLGFLTLLSSTTITTTQVQAASSSSSSFALARRFLSSSFPFGESEPPPINLPSEAQTHPQIPTCLRPSLCLTPPPSQSQSSGGMQPKKFNKGSCKSWRKKMNQVQKLISTVTVMDAPMSDSKESYTSLAQEGISSLLNSHAFEGFTYTLDQICHLFNAAYSGSPRDAAKQATLFQRANEQLV